MQISLKTSADSNFEGICPGCKEWTTAGDSCCGSGAWVEGGLISDQSAQETLEDPIIAITVLKDAPREHAEAVHQLMFTSDVSSVMHAPGNSEKWSVTIQVRVSQLPALKMHE